jgi:hypothetical protein
MALETFALERVQSAIGTCSSQRRRQLDSLADVTLSVEMEEQKSACIWRNIICRSLQDTQPSCLFPSSYYSNRSKVRYH